jgi:hypothetical protein
MGCWTIAGAATGGIEAEGMADPMLPPPPHATSTAADATAVAVAKTCWLFMSDSLETAANLHG